MEDAQTKQALLVQFLVLHLEEIYSKPQKTKFRQTHFLDCLSNILHMANTPIESPKLSLILSTMVKTNLQNSTTYDVAKFLQISHHSMGQKLIDSESKQLLTADVANRVTLYKAPIYLACTMHEPILETARARSLLNKVASFTRATPTDLNVVIKRSLELALQRGEDVAEIGSHFYSRMMRKVTREEEQALAKKVKAKDPSAEVFSEYLRRVYTFGCW